MVKKQKLKSISAKHTKISKIKKSDEIIVVKKTPIEQIINQTKGAKEVRKAIKKLTKKEETLDKKVKDVKKVSKKSHDLYTQSNRLISNAYSPESYSSVSKIDYAELFNYFSKQETIERLFSDYEKSVVKAEKLQGDELGEKRIIQEQDLMSYLNRFMLNSFVGQAMNDISIEEKEKMNYFAMFNKTWVMLKTSLLGLGERTYHAFQVLDYLFEK